MYSRVMISNDAHRTSQQHGHITTSLCSPALQDKTLGATDVEEKGAFKDQSLATPFVHPLLIILNLNKSNDEKAPKER